MSIESDSYKIYTYLILERRRIHEVSIILLYFCGYDLSLNLGTTYGYLSMTNGHTGAQSKEKTQASFSVNKFYPSQMHII